MVNKIKISSIILAAGNSSRMNSTISKLLHKIANKYIINYVIDSVKSIFCEDIIIVVRDQQNNISKEVSKNYPEAKMITQQAEGTAAAVNSAIKILPRDATHCLILCSDTPFISSTTLNSLKKEAEKGLDLVLVAFDCYSSNQYGRLQLKNNQLHSIVEYAEADDDIKASVLCNSGIMLVKSDILKKYISKIKNNNIKQEYYITDLIEILAKNNSKLGYIKADEQEVLGINNRHELIQAESIIQKKLRDNLINNGVNFINPQTVHLSHDTVIGKDSVIHPFVYFGENVNIGAHVEIKSFSHIEGSVINDNATIGPYVRVRPKSLIESEVQLGNFVEIKNSTIKNFSKVNHLSYIGDSYIGKNTNIGAGTITCNYDGIKKHKTIIGDNVFVGSNTSLIAPINVQNNSMIAAGSVVTNDVPEETLAIARADLKLKIGWMKKIKK